MRRFPFIVLCLFVATLTACITDASPQPLLPSGTPGPTVTPAPTRIPAPTWTPTPVPTPTPIPPVRLQVDWPARVSPLAPLPVAARLIPPPGIVAIADVTAKVLDPEGKVFTTLTLSERNGEAYASPGALELPLEPLPGTWWLIVHVESGLPQVGMPVVPFEAEPVVFRDLADTLPSGVALRVPTAFEEVLAQGDPVAGARAWAHGAGEVGLWWAPGPTEALLVNNALVMLEATYAADDRAEPPPLPEMALPISWQGRTAFEFVETWPGPTGGPGRAWVVQGDDLRLYVLRVRALGAPAIPLLHIDVVNTFAFAGDG